MERLFTPVERIHLELTNKCNFSCEFCPSRIMTRPKGFMKEDLAKRALDEIASSNLAWQVDLHIMGEPTLHPKLSEIVAYGTGLGLKMSITTNGSLLTRNIVDSLKEAGLNELIISVQTPDEESFEKRSPNQMSFNTYAQRIELATKRIIGSVSKTKIIITFRTTPFRKFLLPSTRISLINNNKDLRKHLKVWITRVAKDLIQSKDLEDSLSRLNRFSALKWNRLEVAPRLSFESRILGDWVHSKIDKPDGVRTRLGFCHGLSENFGILWNGDFVFCCADFNGRTRVGLNISDTPIVEWMQHPDVVEAAAEFLKCRVKHDYCQNCLGGPSRIYAFAKTVGSIYYFKFYRNNQKNFLTKPEKENKL